MTDLGVYERRMMHAVVMIQRGSDAVVVQDWRLATNTPVAMEMVVMMARWCTALRKVWATSCWHASTITTNVHYTLTDEQGFAVHRSLTSEYYR